MSQSQYVLIDVHELRWREIIKQMGGGDMSVFLLGEYLETGCIHCVAFSSINLHSDLWKKLIPIPHPVMC